MTDFDDSFIKTITDQLSHRLKRELTTAEKKAFELRRSGVAYELILDFISNKEKTQNEIEQYVESVVRE